MICIRELSASCGNISYYIQEVMILETSVKKRTAFIYPVLLILTMLTLVMRPAQVTAAVRKSLYNCINAVIPSLFAMMALSQLMISSGAYRLLGRPFGIAARYLFRIPEDMLSVFFISVTAGYPIGASLTAQAYRDNALTREQAEDMLCWCFGAGPAFIFGTVGMGVFGSMRCGAVLFISCIAADILTGIVTALGRPVPPKCGKGCDIRFSADMPEKAVVSAGKAMFGMCTVILIVSALLAIPCESAAAAHIADAVGKLLGTDPYDMIVLMRSAAEISNISFLTGDERMLPAAAAALSFGGISVLMQVRSVCGGLRIGRMAVMRIFAAGSAYIICYLLNNIMTDAKTAAVNAGNDISIRHNPPILSVFLLIMTIFLLSQKRVEKSERM